MFLISTLNLINLYYNIKTVVSLDFPLLDCINAYTTVQLCTKTKNGP